ncbi:MAG TPA: hypothetical protein VFW98_14825 [Gemmatimonadaceae bacterium]|nr:hypothetical protein [Gemmatimonadaceae bacterium]
MTRSRILSTLTAALFLAVGISCTSDSFPTGPTAPEATTAVPAPSPSLLGGLLGTLSNVPIVSGLLTCSPQPYAADTLVVGSDGGTLHIGPHTFVIPRGALSSPVRIIGEAPSDKVVSVRFQPEGLRFNRRHLPQLTLDYSSCGLVANILPKQIVYTDDSLNILTVLTGSLDNLLSDRVSAPIKHFSRYAVAW